MTDCTRKIDAAEVLARLAVSEMAARPTTNCRPQLRRRQCLDCLSEGLHDAADVVEGVAERGGVIL